MVLVNVHALLLPSTGFRGLRFIAYIKKYITMHYMIKMTSYIILCHFNPLTPNDHYSGRTASLTSKRCILYIYSTNIGTEYFRHGINSQCFLFKMQFFL